MGIVHRLIDPRSDYKFIHRRSLARRFRPAITELPRRLFARFFDDGSSPPFRGHWRAASSDLWARPCLDSLPVFSAARGIRTVYSAHLNYLYWLFYFQRACVSVIARHYINGCASRWSAHC